MRIGVPACKPRRPQSFKLNSREKPPITVEIAKPVMANVRHSTDRPRIGHDAGAIGKFGKPHRASMAKQNAITAAKRGVDALDGKPNRVGT